MHPRISRAEIGALNTPPRGDATRVLSARKNRPSGRQHTARENAAFPSCATLDARTKEPCSSTVAFTMSHKSCPAEFATQVVPNRSEIIGEM